MEFTGERVVPYAETMRARPDLVRQHVARYNWALGLVAGKRAVDLGCGAGYGAFMLSWLAESVVGLDVDEETVEFAKEHFPGVDFRVADLDAVDEVPEADVYVAFDVLEHLEEPEALLAKLDGALLWSVPINHPSEYHRHRWSREQIEAMFPQGTKFAYQLHSGAIVRRGQLPKRPGDVKHVLGVSRMTADDNVGDSGAEPGAGTGNGEEGNEPGWRPKRKCEGCGCP
jgi:2-polyprenyl-3-methyl-5-hydroxy-6-metoxy-1,4-benzoquinol methylase